MSIADRLRALADEVAVLEAVDPPPPPPPPVDALVHSEPLNLARVVCFELQAGIDRYDREQNEIVLGNSASMVIVCCDFAAGGAGRPFSAASYVVRANGEPVGTFVPPSATAVRGTVKLDLSAVPDGNVALTIDVTAPESNGTWWSIKGAGDPELLPVEYQSFDWVKGKRGHKWAMAPRRFTPTAVPLAPMQHAPLQPGVSRTKLHLTEVVIHRGTNVQRPAKLSTGQWTTANRQPYSWAQFTSRLPQTPLLDGPRGVGTIVMPTDIIAARDGSAYVLDPWGVRYVSLDGTVTTKIGRRHKHPPSYWNGPQDLERVGDWSAIEAAGGPLDLHEPWRMRWRPRSVLVDESAPLVLNDRTGQMEAPHPAAPQLLIADTRNGRILLATADPRSHATPWRVTLLADGLGEPWGVAIDDDDWVYVTERTGHKLTKFHFDTPGERIVMAQGLPLASVDSARFVRVTGTLAERRAQPCVLPEGLDLQGDWLTFGSLAQQQVRRIHRYTHEIQTLFQPATDGISKYVQLSLGPDGTIYAVTWGLGTFGLPEVWRPTGTGYAKWPLSISGDLPSGAGGSWGTWGYPTAACASADRIYFGGAHEGLGMLRMSMPSDPVLSATRYRAGAEAWADAGHKLLHGHGGHGFFGLPLPWGESPEVDYYLACHGNSH